MSLFLTIMIIVFVMIMLSVVSYQNFQIIGITFAPEHAETQEVKALQQRFKVEQAILGVVFVGVTQLTTIDTFQGWRDLAFILVLFSYIILSYIPFVTLQRRLMALKQKHNWIYETQKRIADISVTREKGKAAPSKQWVWLIWMLGLVPLIVAALTQSPWTMLLPLLLVPIIMLVIPLSYDTVIRVKTPFVSKNSNVTQAYMRRYERANALSYLQMSFTVNIFFIAFTTLMLFYLSNIWAVVLLMLFFVVLIGLIINTVQKNKALQAEFFDQADWQMTEEKGRYKWGAYYNPEDTRLLVPKRAVGMGVTINVAHPAGKIIMGLIGVLTVGLIGMTLVMSTANFDVSIQSESVPIEVPMYGIEVAFDQIESIELSQAPLDGTRTNGFGGEEKKFWVF